MATVGDQGTVQGVPAEVVALNPAANPPLLGVLLNNPVFRWVPAAQFTPAATVAPADAPAAK